jgi:hypothetical protein
MYDTSKLALDLVHRELFVTNLGRIDVYPTSADGAIAPLRTITGTKTLLGELGGIAIDRAADEIYVTAADSGAIHVFPRAGAGDVAPLRSLAGVDTELVRPQGIFLDLAHGEIFVVDDGGATPAAPGVLVFALAASGNVPPVRAISGASTLLDNPKSVVVDLVHDEILVTEFDAWAVRAYGRSLGGDVAPLRQVAGPQTNLGPAGELLLTREDEMLVVNRWPDSWFVGLERSAVADADSLRYVGGANTGLSLSTGIAASRARECSAGRAVDGCLYRDNFESGATCDWSQTIGAATCG